MPRQKQKPHTKCIAREIKDSFWNDMKNNNQTSSSNNNTKQESEEKKHVGPDKGKGGRVIGDRMVAFVKSSQTSS